MFSRGLGAKFRTLSPSSPLYSIGIKPVQIGKPFRRKNENAWLLSIVASSSLLCGLATTGYLLGRESEQNKDLNFIRDIAFRESSSRGSIEVGHTYSILEGHRDNRFDNNEKTFDIKATIGRINRLLPGIYPLGNKVSFCDKEVNEDSYLEEIVRKKGKDITDENRRKFSWNYIYTGVSPDKYSLETLEQMVVFAGSKSKQITEEICAYIGLPIGKMDSSKFADGEVFIQVNQEMRGRDCFVVIPTIDNDSVMELLLAVSTLRRASSKCITAIIPYFGYARQDQRGGFRREPIAAADFANMLEEMGVDRVIAVDLHSPQIQGFFKPTTVVDHLTAAAMIASYFKDNLPEFIEDSSSKKSKGVVVVASHEGQVRRARIFREHLAKQTKVPIHMAMVSKFKDEEGNVVNTVLGDVKDSTCIIIDDLVDTASTLVTTTELLKEQGAWKVYGFATHARFSSGGDIRVHNTKDLEYIVVTNSIPMLDSETRLLDSPKIKVISIAPLIAEAILNISSGSVSSLVTSSEANAYSKSISEKEKQNRSA